MQYEYDRFQVALEPVGAGYRAVLTVGGERVVFEERRSRWAALEAGARMVAGLACMAPETILAQWLCQTEVRAGSGGH